MSDLVVVEAGLEAARAIAAAAEREGGGWTWRSEVLIGTDGDEPVIGRGDVGFDLYEGAAGIAMALAAAARVAGDDRALTEVAGGAARRALEGGRAALEDGRLGLYDGATGPALAAATVGRVLGDEVLERDGRRLADAVVERIDDVEQVDVLSGVAGVVLGLLGVAAITDAPTPVEACARVANRLIELAETQVWGVAWSSSGIGDESDGDRDRGGDRGDAAVTATMDATAAPPLLGLAHGAAGIALALAEAAVVTGDPMARATALGACEYERAWYDAERVAWPDLREHDVESEPASWMSAWCHGAFGIGLSRLRLSQIIDDELMTIEASAALQAARDLVVASGTALQRDGIPQDCSPCHGLAGAVELLLAAHRAFGGDEHLAEARRVARLMLDHRDRNDGLWPCGLPNAGEIPALMTGTAGISLTLLAAGTGQPPIPTPLLPGPYSIPRD